MLYDTCSFFLGEGTFEVVQTLFQHLFKMPETESPQYLMGLLEQLKKQSLRGLFRFQSWLKRAFSATKNTGGLGKESAASPLPPFFTWVHFTVMPQ